MSVYVCAVFSCSPISATSGTTTDIRDGTLLLISKEISKDKKLKDITYIRELATYVDIPDDFVDELLEQGTRNIPYEVLREWKRQKNAAGAVASGRELFDNLKDDDDFGYIVVKYKSELCK